MTEKPEQPPTQSGVAEATEIVVARQHVEQFEQRVERQRQLLQELERDKHVNMLVEARKVLETLEHSLRLAHQHLQLEIDRHGR